MMEALKNFVKYNAQLVHLDLTMTGLQAPIIVQIGHFLTRATSLQSIHLCGNEGVTEEMISWLRSRIKARDDISPLNIQPLPKHLSTKGVSRTGSQPDIMSLFGLKEKVQPDPQTEWKELRAGLKLQSIVNSKRMNEIVHARTFDMRRCIISRHIGYKKMIPGAG